MLQTMALNKTIALKKKGMTKFAGKKGWMQCDTAWCCTKGECVDERIISRRLILLVP